MYSNPFPVIGLPATGANIRRLRQSRDLSVRDLQQTLQGYVTGGTDKDDAKIEAGVSGKTAWTLRRTSAL